MSAIVSFILVPKASLDGLHEAATPKRSWLGKPKDTYCDYLKQHGREVAEYKCSGYALATLLPFLQERQIDLMTSEFDELAIHLTQNHGATHSVVLSCRQHRRLIAVCQELLGLRSTLRRSTQRPTFARVVPLVPRRVPEDVQVPASVGLA